MPALHLVSSAIQINFQNPAGETQSARHIRHQRPVCDNISLITPKSEPHRPNPWVIPHGKLPSIAPSSREPSAPRPSLPPSSWQVTVQPFGSKEVHRFTGSHSPGMRLVLSMA